jgi:hypothetical protein
LPFVESDVGSLSPVCRIVMSGKTTNRVPVSVPLKEEDFPGKA